jgi:hypothetical protein
MTDRSKKQILNKTLLCKIALVILMGFSLVACSDDKDWAKPKGTVTANAEGVVLFKYSRSSSSSPASCTFTTDLPAPNKEFVLTITSGNTAEDKVIEGLTAGQKVTWTATVEGKPMNHGSGNFVHVINN